MVEDLESIARKTLDYLGVPWDDTVLRFHERTQQKLVITPSHADVTRPVLKTARGRWRIIRNTWNRIWKSWSRSSRRLGTNEFTIYDLRFTIFSQRLVTSSPTIRAAVGAKATNLGHGRGGT